jgi:hypothetical protein
MNMLEDIGNGVAVKSIEKGFKALKNMLNLL